MSYGLSDDLDSLFQENQKLEKRIEELESKLDYPHEEIAQLESRIEAGLKLKRYAVQSGGFGGWEIVEAKGNESQTFVDAEELCEALGGSDAN